jgi:hypothetical protein
MNPQCKARQSAEASFPDLGISPGVQARYHDNVISIDAVENPVGESVDERAAGISMDDGVLLWVRIKAGNNRL